ncbi:MAG TPA: MobF family relaxase [Verrucomicrobiae bacterium]|nr:MobF family relaxase [Verrucomicrobiae bacterium]
MIRPKAQYSLADAKRYFKEHLSVGDYYAEGQHVAGQWFGKGAADLGLQGATTLEQFERLCENLHPATGEKLTLRQNVTRIETGKDGVTHETANRRVFYDFTFSPPKSVSIAVLVCDDKRIVAAHGQAIRAAMNELQSFAATRVRKSGQCTDRTTGNVVAAVFRHETSRALDPHLHSHCIVFNATYDGAEKQWKALQNHDMLAAQKFVDNVYYHELARELVKCGYQIENKPRGDFEIRGISQELIDKFSKRRNQIDEKTKELLAREPDKANGNIAAIRENIAHKERPPKVRDMALSRLQTMWNDQMTVRERNSLHTLTTVQTPKIETSAVTAKDAVAWAEEHVFERRSVVPERELWRHALEHARGENIRLADIQAATRQRPYLRSERHPGQVTLREHLEREWDIVCMAKDGQSRCPALAFDCRASNRQLDDEQREAVNRLVGSTSFVSLFRGGAGTGKSFTLREVQNELQSRHCTVLVVAPQRQQVLGLEADGLKNVETVSAFLARHEMPRNAVMLVDEAGQIGGKQMHALFRFAQANDSRLILSGDTRQHGAVEATDALRAIEKYSGIEDVELTNIRRQNPALGKSEAEREQIKRYRQAVADARDGKLVRSFDRLDKLQAIEQCTLADQHEKLAARYLELAGQNHSCVVVSQSWNEIHKVNSRIRETLKNEGRIDSIEMPVETLQPVDLTDAQKREARSYVSGSVVVFNRNVKRFKTGDVAQFKAVADGHLLVERDGESVKVPFGQLDKITVCQKKELVLSAGDKLQLKANGRAADGRKLASGELVTVKETRPDGRIVLTDGRVLGKNFRQFVHGYSVTSYASQGKSVDYVLFSDSTVKAATNNQQWYVTISRGKKGIHIFTCDKEQLRDNIMRSGDRPLALDAVADKGDSRTVAVRQIQAFLRERTARQEAENRRKSHSMRMGM